MLPYKTRASSWPTWLLLLCAFSLLVRPALTVHRDKFKTCDQSGFCKRNRAYADTAAQLGSKWESPYKLDAKSLTFKDGQLSGTILKSLSNSDEVVRLPLTVAFLESGTARVTVDEEKRQKGEITLRHDSKARKERYNEAAKWAIVGGLEPSKGAALSSDAESGTTKVRYGPAGAYEAVITHAPFAIDFRRDDQTHVRFNERGLMSLEHWRAKVEKEKKEGEEQAADVASQQPVEDESTWWEESFGGKSDSKPRGPESIALDISFPGYEHVYGIPGHASPLSLPETRAQSGNYKDPYRFYNLDVFEYEMNNPMALYGAIPLMQAHRKDSTVGVFWLNAAETWIDVLKTKISSNPLSLGIGAKTTTQTHWISESGIMDVFVLLGPTPSELNKKYGELTGYQQLPPQFAVGYHQCRWNYVSDEDVMDVERKFDKHNMPVDVIWLDIEYTDKKKYFTWDPLAFPNPTKMHKQLDKHQRKVVLIIDPHIKKADDYPVVQELKSKDLAAHDKDDKQFEGHCWPGASYWIDCFNPAAISWWKSLFKYDRFVGTGPNTFIWNDMNEPSVFDGPENTMPKDNLHHGKWEHRDVHNLNGMTYHNATHEALRERKKGELRRPFVLTRSYFAGSQRLGAMWTGDNVASWDHLAAAGPMVLSHGIAGFPFAGADVGGFFGNPDKQLLTRWYQAGAFNPFFRAHAHIDTRRREPYLLGSPHSDIITQTLRLRYSLLPAWYTAFHESSTTGAPIVRPNYYVHPADESGFAIDDQMYLGSTGLLLKPVVTEGAEFVDIYLADDERYYDYFDYKVYTGPGYTKVEAPLEKTPLLMRGGHIIPRRDRPRRSSGLMKWDPFTLVVVLGKDGNADGTLYLDDGETYDYQQGAYIHRKFVFDKATGLLTSTDISAGGPKAAAYLKTMSKVSVERVIVVGAPEEWKGRLTVAVVEEGAKVSAPKKTAGLTWHAGESGKAAWAVVRNPKVLIGKGWKINFNA